MTNREAVLSEYVQLLDSMGNDLSVVNAARASMGKVSFYLDDKDKKLIKYLAKHEHWTPILTECYSVPYKDAHLRS